ncbi:MAG TPA: SDR family NAD(P)-dependent oxidoreductase [Phenylobacterium sp.]|jgi:NAD(P)-dependent dehydrogenase (short-subunit alcohol dehydrogenase family)|uniref:SDR family oxidoreductase n=1 Tax=Phenylobacterium sp. TaxID=1871053 RepID=UPI002BBD6421|nr:SDR family NAD(P)-dependent oxidoreductase [Phenylobacterium sp.]HXA38818.1 SDR family NAD(P)-dependent oxidoreductase [Phenylobacterium sp.]
MQDLAGKFAVVTGGGTGMGRELVRQLIAEGCSVAMCDVSAKTMAETVALCEADGVPQGARVTAHVADVSDEAQLIAFRDAAAAQHDTDRLHLLFNNAGIGGGGSMIADARAEWERTFNVCWGGVYLGVRTFLPMLQAADEAHIVNTSSVNGFWASLGPNVSHTAYAAAKFAVKGFSEALITDLALNAPHIKVSVVMPGHIGTSIVANSRKVMTGRDEDALSEADLERARARIARMGVDVSQLPDAALQAMVDEQARRFLEEAPMTAAAAATVILDGVKADRWRILVGEDAQKMDLAVRQDPEAAYTPEFFEVLVKEMGWRLGR